MSRYKIAHIGAFDFENYGDILFPYVFENNIKKYIDIEEITLFAPTEGIMPFTKARKVYCVNELEKLHKEMNFDAIVVGGGDLGHFRKIMVSLPAISSDLVMYNVINMWVIPCMVASKYNIPLIFNAPGVPFEFSDNEEKIAKELLGSVDYLTVRDFSSKNNLRNAIEHNKIGVVPDSVLSICNLISKKELDKIYKQTNICMKKEYIIFHANRTFLDEDIKKCSEELIKLKKKYGYEILLFPIGYAIGDIQTLQKIKDIEPEEFVLVEDKLSQFEMLSVIANAKCYIGASLHGCITANAYGVKNFVYSYNGYNKIEGFLELLNRKDLLVFDADKISEKFDEVMEKDIPDINNAISSINQHFESIANVIVNKPLSKREIDLVELVEYIYTNSQTEIELNKMYSEMKLKDNHITNLEDYITKLNNYRDSVGKTISDKDNHIKNIESFLEATRNENIRLEEKIKLLEIEKNNIYNTFSWKITRPIRGIKKIIKRSK